MANALGISRTTLSHAERGKILLSGTSLSRLLWLYGTDGRAPAPSRSEKVNLYEALVACGGVHAL